MGDQLDEQNQKGLVTLGREQFMTRDSKTYGEYEYIPLQEDKKIEIKNAFQLINDICRPTIKKLNQVENISEIQDRIYRQFKNYEGELNVCVMKSKNVRDNNWCADNFINQLNGEGKDYVLNILREY